MNVLSLFDGMSCGQIALNRCGIKYDKYYASEIDKYAIQVTQKNYPNTIQLGDIKNIKGSDLPRIDLIMGGSPCQGFSFAGKHLNFDDPRSKLFFEFVRLLKECKPKYFLLENVKMKKEFQKIISDMVGVEPIVVNSNLVSAQNRTRLYWTNIPFTIPKDRGIILQNIIENGAVDRQKSYCVDANYFKGGNPKSYFEKHRRQLVFDFDENLMCGAFRGRYQKNGSTKQQLELRYDNKTNTLTSVQKDNVIVMNRENWRKLTVLECERLQTIPEGYTEGVSNTQRYKMIGNAWTVDIIVEVLKNKDSCF